MLHSSRWQERHELIVFLKELALQLLLCERAALVGGAERHPEERQRPLLKGFLSGPHWNDMLVPSRTSTSGGHDMHISSTLCIQAGSIIWPHCWTNYFLKYSIFQVGRETHHPDANALVFNQ